jgi:aspartyl-tRNA(Asn)/glutamyl-tRNA(Gln) amidotransferase subunit C
MFEYILHNMQQAENRKILPIFLSRIHFGILEAINVLLLMHSPLSYVFGYFTLICKIDSTEYRVVELGDIEKVAKLAKIALTSQEVAQFSKELVHVFHWVETLERVDIPEVEEAAMQYCPMVEDIPQNVPSPEALLANAPECRINCFVVPKVVGGE